MGKDTKWPRAALVTAIQFSALLFATVMLLAWGSQKISGTESVWWQPLLLSVVGGVALLLYLIQSESKAEHAKKELEAEVAAKTEELNRTQTAIIFGLAKLAESRDTDTGAHLDRVRKYVTILAKDLSLQHRQLDESTIQKLALASSLHDIGKVGIPDAILLKPGMLSDGERKIMEYHTSIGGECLEAIQNRLGENDFLKMAQEIALSHHERWDGTGYPLQLSGTAIPLVARIMSLADVYDALTSKRPYKKARSHDSSRQVLLAGKGTQFDPDVVDAFIRHEAEFEAISISQKTVADEDCMTGLQRLHEAVEAMQSSTTNLIGLAVPNTASTPIVPTNSNPIG